MRHAMVMAGGAGSRLWPLSTAARPKQFVPMIERSDGGLETLIGISARRLHGLVPDKNLYVCTGESSRDAVLESLPGITDEHILGEPVGRDTVNAVGFAAAVISKHDPDAVMCVVTADHLIEPVDRFQHLMDLGFRLVEQQGNRLVTFAIKPTSPATGFGYVQRGPAITTLGDEAASLACRVRRFVEKPGIVRAREYVESGEYGWNSGMFVWKAATVLDCLKRFKPESYEGVMQIQKAWGTIDQDDVLARVYPTLPKISVDYAVMEPACADESLEVVTVEMDVSWLDVGSWTSFGQTLAPDEQGNRVQGRGATLMVDCRNNIVAGADKGHTIAMLGCEGLVVVRTPGAILIMPADKAQDLKSLYERLPEVLR